MYVVCVCVHRSFIWLVTTRLRFYVCRRLWWNRMICTCVVLFWLCFVRTALQSSIIIYFSRIRQIFFLFFALSFLVHTIHCQRRIIGDHRSFARSQWMLLRWKYTNFVLLFHNFPFRFEKKQFIPCTFHALAIGYVLYICAQQIRPRYRKMQIHFAAIDSSFPSTYLFL